MVLQMHPDPTELVELIKHLIQEDKHNDWGWSNVFIAYESDDGKLHTFRDFNDFNEINIHIIDDFSLINC